MKLASGHIAEDLPQEEWEHQQENFKGYENGLTRINPGGWILPKPFLKNADDVFNFKILPDDVFIMTWPKCGTTWTQEIVTTMRKNPNLDKEPVPFHVGSPFIEFDMFTSEKNFDPSDLVDVVGADCPRNKNFLKLAQIAKPPRTLKTHLPFSFLPPDLIDKAKVLLVVRNPKDVLVSYLHHSKLLKVHDYVGTDAQFAEYYMKGDLVYGDYRNFLKEGLAKKGHKNLHIIHYEDIKKDPKNELMRLNDFLGTGLDTSQIEKICEYTTFKAMKERSEKDASNLISTTVNLDVIEKDGGFLRKGVVGDFKNKLPENLQDRIDKWTEDLKFEFKY